MVDYSRPVGIEMLLQDLYTPPQYNPAEYTLMGYDPSTNIGAGPMYSYNNPMSPGAAVTPAVGMPGMGNAAPGAAPQAVNPGYNQTVEEIAAKNKAEYLANNPESVWTPDQGIAAMPKERQVGFGGYDAYGIIYDDKGRGYDVTGRMVSDEYGRGGGMTAQQRGLTPEMAARGYTLADVWGP